MQRKALIPVLLAVLLLVPAATVAGLRDDMVLKPEFKGLTWHGSYASHAPVAIGTVTDMRSVTDTKLLGQSAQGIYQIYSADPPAVWLRSALEQTLGSLGLAAREGEAPVLTVDAEIWRTHLWVRMGARARLRGEINMRFKLSRAGEPAGIVSVIGNAEIKGQMVTKERWKVLFEQTLYDTMDKFASSETFRKALPQEVTASFQKPASPEPEGRYRVDQIEMQKFYGPTELVAQLPKFDLTGYDVLEIRPFKLTDTNFKGDVEATERMFPAAVMDRIGGLYPALFAAASFGSTTVGQAPSGARRLVIEGDLPQVAAGSAMKRALIGFGAGRVSLAMNVRLVDGETGKPIGQFEMKSLNWGAGWQTDEGELPDMVERMASDLSHYLVNQRNPSYKSSYEEVR